MDSGAPPPGFVENLERFISLLERQSGSQSLVAAGDRSTLFTRHVLDSLNPLGAFDEPPERVLDVGSGAGFPGIPLALAWPTSRVVLLESRERKAAFLERMVREIPMRNVAVVCDRLEHWAPSYKGDAFDAVFVRAVGDLPELLHSLSLVGTPGGRWVYFLGEGREPETLMPAHQGEVLRGSFEGRLLSGRFPSP